MLRWVFVANPDLMRGDVILKFDGVELVDIANNRIGSNYTSEAVRGDVAAPIEGAVIASDDAANTDPDGSGASLVDADLSLQQMRKNMPLIWKI